MVSVTPIRLIITATISKGDMAIIKQLKSVAIMKKKALNAS
jgi:hypothetical protein